MTFNMETMIVLAVISIGITVLVVTALFICRPTSYDPFSEPFGDVPNAGGTDDA